MDPWGDEIVRPKGAIVPACVGVAFTVAAWLALGLWMLPGDDSRASRVALVGLVVATIAFVHALAREGRGRPEAFALAGLVAWTVLFAWRAVATPQGPDSGANLFAIPVVFVFIPTTVVVPLLVRRLRERVGENVRAATPAARTAVARPAADQDQRQEAGIA